MDESLYHARAAATFRTLLDLFDDIDPDQADVESSGDVISIAYANGKRCIINTQRPTRQLWLAADDRAWHFSFDEARGQWFDDRGSGAELVQTVQGLNQRLMTGVRSPPAP